MFVESLPTTEDDLKELVAKLGFTADDGKLPFWDDSGTWRFDPAAGWDDAYWFEGSGIADWRVSADPRYEGLEDKALAVQALAEGRLPGHLVDEDALIELFKDGAGNVYLQLDGVKATDGHLAVFFFDHDTRWTITACARTLAELYGRKVLEKWMETHGRDRELWKLIHSPVALDPASVAEIGESLADGWRAAVGLAARTTPIDRRAPQRSTVTGERFQNSGDLKTLKSAWVERFITESAVDREALNDLLKPLTWWQVGTFTDLDASLRNLIARIASLTRMPLTDTADDAEEARRRDQHGARKLLAAAEFLDGLFREEQISLNPSVPPTDLVRSACKAALKQITGARSSRKLPDGEDGKRLLDSFPSIALIHAAWSGTVPDEVLAQGDQAAFAIALQYCKDLNLIETTVYNMIRSCGDNHIDALAAKLPDLLPSDQIMVLHGLDNFPKHAGVLALYDDVLANSPHGNVKEAATRYRHRVASGIKPSGWEK